MESVINETGKFLMTHPYIVFAALGYATGALMRDINPFKVVGWFILVPYCVNVLRSINLVYAATLPYLAAAVVGFIGWRQTQDHLTRLRYAIQDRLRR